MAPRSIDSFVDPRTAYDRGNVSRVAARPVAGLCAWAVVRYVASTSQQTTFIATSGRAGRLQLRDNRLSTMVKIADTAMTTSRVSLVVLLGDSIFDDGAYTGGGPDVLTQVRDALEAEWRATLGAVDGATTEDVAHQ